MKKLNLPDFSKLTIEKERTQSDKIKSRIAQYNLERKRHLLIGFLDYLYKKGYFRHGLPQAEVIEFLNLDNNKEIK